MTGPEHEGAEQQIGLVGPPRTSSWTNHLLDWIALADPKCLPDRSVRLYWILKSFIIEDKGQETERVVQIIQEDLAQMMHCSVDTIQRALKPLYKMGLVEDKERRKVSSTEPGQKKPTITTLLIMQINEPEPPAGYEGWLRPFDARKEIRAERAAAKASAKAAEQAGAKASNGTGDEAGVLPGQSDTADLRSQIDQGSEAIADGGEVSAAQTDTANLRSRSDQAKEAEHGAVHAGAADATQPPVDNLAKIANEPVSAGQCDTANQPDSGADLLETGANLLQNGAGLRPIGSNPPVSNLSGSNTSGSWGATAAPQTPASMINSPSSVVVTDQLELLGNAPHTRAEQEPGAHEHDPDSENPQVGEVERQTLLKQLTDAVVRVETTEGPAATDAVRDMLALRNLCRAVGLDDDAITAAEQLGYQALTVQPAGKVITRSGRVRTARRRSRR